MAFATFGWRRKRAVPSPDKFKLTPVVPSEHAVQVSILALLRRHPKVAKAIRYNSGRFRLVGVGGLPDRWFSANDCQGHSDIAGVLKGGRAFYLEVKEHGLILVVGGHEVNIQEEL